jgi:hypothetical protein
MSEQLLRSSHLGSEEFVRVAVRSCKRLVDRGVDARCRRVQAQDPIRQLASSMTVPTLAGR